MRLVRPGERLFIVKGVAEWRRAQARAKAEATLGRRWMTARSWSSSSAGRRAPSGA